jgi:hypothetical protein
MEGDRVDDNGAYLPSKEEIKRLCAEFQKTWSPYERRTRSLGYDTSETFDNIKFQQHSPQGIRRGRERQPNG